ncbi:MAG: hypothetical protein ABI769_14030 [Pseudomonadota bacterium]
MKTIQILVAVTLLGAASVASAQINMPNPGAPGGSYDTAIRIVVTNDFMVERYISRWLRTHYPGWNSEPHELQEIGNEKYAIVYITAANNPGRRVYFRVLGSQREGNDDGGASFP